MNNAQKRKLAELQDIHCKRYNKAVTQLDKAYHAAILAHLYSLHALENCLFNQRALEIALAVSERYAAIADTVYFDDDMQNSLYSVGETYENLLAELS